MRTAQITAILSGLLAVMALPVLPAAELELSVDLENPVVLAGRPSASYLKVGLKGFEWNRQGERAPLNVALVLDRSGSMEGEKLRRAKEAARYAVDLLSSRDILSVITYESEVQVLVPATRVADRRAIHALIDRIEVDGSTALFAGVTRGAAEARKFLSREQVNRVILLSDGIANVGPDSPGELAELGTSLRREGISVTTIGLGTDYNEDLMARLAQASDGNHAFVQEPRDLVRIFDAEFKDALSVVARDVKVTVTCAPGIRPVRILNREGEIRGQTVTFDLNQVYSLQEKYILVEVEIPAMGAGSTRTVADVRGTYLNLQTTGMPVLTRAVSVRASTSQDELVKNRQKEVAEAVALQKNVLAGAQAIRLRDEGRVEEAKKVLEDSAAELDLLSEELDSPILEQAGAAATQDAKDLEKEEEWQVQRKSMRASQYSTENQQSY